MIKKVAIKINYLIMLLISMTFGKINKIIKYIEKYILQNKLENLKKEDYYTTINKIVKDGIDTFPEINFRLVEEILSKKYDLNYTTVNEIKFSGGYNCFPDFKALYKPIVIPDEYKALEEHFQKLKALPQPEQRTKEWYEYRHNRITASDTAAAIDLNPYEPVENFILKKTDPNYAFLDNDNVYHGKKFEQVATQIYEHIYNAEVIEFGALPSEKYNLLGASPDGICSSRTLDNEFSPRLGTMLEIKCVVQRQIETSGNIKGTICPFYYYCQVQQQLECCELELCDFWQCKILEYQSREEYLIDKRTNTFHTYDNNAKKMEISNLLKKGIILQFYPFEFKPQFEGDKQEWKSKFIYPPRIDMNEKEYDDWVLYTLNNLQDKYKDIIQTHYFHKIIYWKLDQSHNQPIKRDRSFMQNILPILNDTWELVKYYRNNLDKLDELRVIEKKRKIYRKMITEFTINNDLIKNKVLFLDTPSIEPPVKVKNVKLKEAKSSPDFLEDDEKPKEIVKEVVKEVAKPTKKKVNIKKKKVESDKEDDGKYIYTKPEPKKDDVDFLD